MFGCKTQSLKCHFAVQFERRQDRIIICPVFALKLHIDHRHSQAVTHGYKRNEPSNIYQISHFTAIGTYQPGYPPKA